MASQYIKKQLRKLQADPNLLDSLSNKLAVVTSKCYEKLSTTRKKLHPLITSLISELNTDPVEDHVRKARISNIKQQKTLLQQKLDQINKSIEQGEIEEHHFKKPNLQYEKIRHEFFKEEQEKSKQNAQKVKEYYSEQLKRQEKIRKHIEGLNKDLAEEKAKRSISQRERTEKFEEEYMKELEKMQERTRRRKKELEEKQIQHLEKEIIIKNIENFYKDRMNMFKQSINQEKSIKRILDYEEKVFASSVFKELKHKKKAELLNLKNKYESEIEDLKEKFTSLSH